MSYKGSSNELREILNDELARLQKYEKDVSKDQRDIYGHTAIAEGYREAADIAKKLGDKETAYTLLNKSYDHYTQATVLGKAIYKKRLENHKTQKKSLTPERKGKASYVVKMPPSGPDYDLKDLESMCSEMKKQRDKYSKYSKQEKYETPHDMNPMREFFERRNGPLALFFFILTMLFLIPAFTGNVISANLKIISTIGAVFFILFLLFSYSFVKRHKIHHKKK